MLKIKSVKITPEQLEEIEKHLETANYILNSERQLDFDEMTEAQRNIFDALQNIKTIRERINRSNRRQLARRHQHDHI